MRLRRAASSASSAICRVVAVGGFSSITCLPARSAVNAASKCAWGGVQIEMQSRSGTAASMVSRSGKFGDAVYRGIAAGAGRQLEAGFACQRRNVLIARNLADAEQANLQPHLVSATCADRLEEIRRGRQFVFLAEIEQRGVFPMRAGAPTCRAARGNPGGFPVHDPHAADPQGHLNDIVHEALLAARRRRIPAVQRVFTQQVGRLVARVAAA